MPTGGKTQVLVVEDEALIGLMFEQFLTDYGYAVIGPIENLQAAELLAATEQIDVAVVDIDIAGQASTAVADKLMQRKIPFVFVSGYDHVLGLRYSSIPFLQKPFTSEELNCEIERLLGFRMATPKQSRRKARWKKS